MVMLRYLYDEQWSARFFLVDEIVTPDEAATFKEWYELGFGWSVQFQPDFGLFKFDFLFDAETAPSLTDADGAGHVWTASLNGEWWFINDTPWSASHDLSLGNNPNGHQFFILSSLRHDFHQRHAFTALMLNYFDENYDDEAIDVGADIGAILDNERYEPAFAGTWYPLAENLQREFRNSLAAIDGR